MLSERKAATVLSQQCTDTFIQGKCPRIDAHGVRAHAEQLLLLIDVDNRGRAWRHGDLEDLLLHLSMTLVTSMTGVGLLRSEKWDKKSVARVYFGKYVDLAPLFREEYLSFFFQLVPRHVSRSDCASSFHAALILL